MEAAESNQEVTLPQLTKRIEQLEIWCQKATEVLANNAETVLKFAGKFQEIKLAFEPPSSKTMSQPTTDELKSRLSAANHVLQPDTNAEKREEGKVFVEWLKDGKRDRGHFNLKVAMVKFKPEDFDLFSDELKMVLAVKNSDWKQKKLPDEIPPRLRGMLWLVLIDEDGKMGYGDIAKLFRFDNDIQEKSRDGKIQQYRMRFDKELPCELWGRVFGRGDKKSYPIDTNGWSFCWIRQKAQRASSILLHDIPGRPSEDQ